LNRGQSVNPNNPKNNNQSSSNQLTAKLLEKKKPSDNDGKAKDDAE
jgi:hypothetical protein